LDFVTPSQVLEPKAYFVSNLAEVTLLILLIFARPTLAEEPSSGGSGKGLLSIHSVTVAGKVRKLGAGRRLSLGSAPEEVVFNFGPTSNSGWEPKRLRYTLEGYESTWHEGVAIMGLTVRYADVHGDQIGQTIFEARAPAGMAP
jgi:hypothetical protein